MQHATAMKAKGDDAALAGLALEQTKQSIDNENDGNEIDHIEGHALNACRSFLSEFVGEISQRQTILMEGHPEENHHSEDEAKSNDALLGLLRRQFLNVFSLGFSFLNLIGIAFYLTEGVAECVVDDDGDDQ